MALSPLPCSIFSLCLLETRTSPVAVLPFLEIEESLISCLFLTYKFFNFAIRYFSVFAASGNYPPQRIYHISIFIYFNYFLSLRMNPTTIVIYVETVSCKCIINCSITSFTNSVLFHNSLFQCSIFFCI